MNFRSRAGLSLALGVAILACSRKELSSIESADAAPPGASVSAPPPPPANGLPIPSASVTAVVNPANAPPYAGPTGAIEGTIYVSGPEAPEIPHLDTHSCPAALDTYGRLFRAGPARADGLRPLADAVVVVTDYAGGFVPEREETKRVTILPSCGYPTRTIALTFGQRLDIANDSTIAFAPQLSGTPQNAIMIAPPLQRGEPVKLYPPRAGHFLLADRLQPFVLETVVVLRQPLHDVSALSGHYRIDGVPVGNVKVGAQSDALGSDTQRSVEVRANVVEKVDLVLTYAPPDAGSARPREHIIP